jgi:hypothetical protein
MSTKKKAATNSIANLKKQEAAKTAKEQKPKKAPRPSRLAEIRKQAEFVKRLRYAAEDAKGRAKYAREQYQVAQGDLQQLCNTPESVDLFSGTLKTNKDGDYKYTPIEREAEKVEAKKDAPAVTAPPPSTPPKFPENVFGKSNAEKKADAAEKVAL